MSTSSDRRAQGLSINAMIIAALAVLVLIVAIAIYVSTSEKGEATIRSCENQGGTCLPSCDSNQRESFLAECSEESFKCCIG